MGGWDAGTQRGWMLGVVVCVVQDVCVNEPVRLLLAAHCPWPPSAVQLASAARGNTPTPSEEERNHTAASSVFGSDKGSMQRGSLDDARRRSGDSEDQTPRKD